MKTWCVPLAILLTVASASLAQVKITSLDRSGTLSWSNRLCVPLPVYEVLRASSPTGTWQHVAFVTNQTSFALPDLPVDGAAAFFQLAWVSHAPIEFDYAFDEGYAVPAVVGRITLDFTTGSGLGNFQETEFVIDGLHPVGIGPIRMQFFGDALRLYLESILDGGVYLEGGLQSMPDASGCIYTSYNGTAYEADFSGGGTEVGTFVATKVP